MAIRTRTTAIGSETTVHALDPHVVVFTTVVPALGVLIKTTYVGADDVATTAVDLVLGVRPSASAETRTVPRETVPVTHDRQCCLLDHGRQVMNTLRAPLGEPCSVDVPEAALARAAAL